MIFLTLLLSIVSFAAANDPRPEMHVLAQEIAGMEKYLISEAEFDAPQNAEKISGSLEKLNQHLKKLGEGEFSKDPSLKVNLELLTGHLADASRYFKDGNKAFSRYMIQSSLSMCIACHTRGKSEDFALPELEMKGASAIDKAEFYFATRQFKKGKEVYEKLVEEYPKNKVGPYQLRKALLALAVYHARIKADPKSGANYFQRLPTKEFPIYIKKEVNAWGEDFKAWSKEKKSKANSDLEWLAQAKKLLKSDDFSLVGDIDRKFHIRRLRASALLHRVLESPGANSPSKGEALLYLGQIYHRVAYQLFFRFGDMYLKTCVMEYKKSKAGRDCYGALEQIVTEGYSGSSGTSIPEEEELELIQLKRMVF